MFIPRNLKNSQELWHVNKKSAKLAGVLSTKKFRSSYIINQEPQTAFYFPFGTSQVTIFVKNPKCIVSLLCV